MKVINNTFWKQLFETAFRKKQQLALSVEHPVSLSLRKLVKLKSFMVRKFSKSRLKFNIEQKNKRTEAVTRGVL